MLSIRFKSTEVDRRTWLHVPSETPWSTSSDTHQVDKITKRDFYYFCLSKYNSTTFSKGNPSYFLTHYCQVKLKWNQENAVHPLM